ncbi:MAG TPA: glycerophosphodiester phosphodiesterase [Methylomirabilota bacterium]|nr:glycerophosphodiester phosphodiesterase [Methylomirabilota bacterium]
MGVKAALAGLLLGVTSMMAAEIIAHRGASFDAPENSLTAMKVAWEQGADAIETDIHLSKDGKIVVMHDATLKRTAGVDRAVKDQVWAEMKDLDVGLWKGAQFRGEKLPTLESIFATIPDGKAIYTEIKSKEPDLLPELGRLMKESGKKPEQLKIITFHYDVAKAAKAMFSRHEVYWLHDYKEDPGTKQLPTIENLISKAKAANLDGLDLNHRFPIDKSFVEKVHGAGLKLCTWTVDDAAIAKSEVAAGVDGITTNRPEWLRAQLKP